MRCELRVRRPTVVAINGPPAERFPDFVGHLHESSRDDERSFRGLDDSSGEMRMLKQAHNVHDSRIIFSMSDSQRCVINALDDEFGIADPCARDGANQLPSLDIEAIPVSLVKTNSLRSSTFIVAAAKCINMAHTGVIWNKCGLYRTAQTTSSSLFSFDPYHETDRPCSAHRSVRLSLRQRRY